VLPAVRLPLVGVLPLVRRQHQQHHLANLPHQLQALARPRHLGSQPGLVSRQGLGSPRHSGSLRHLDSQLRRQHHLVVLLQRPHLHLVSASPQHQLQGLGSQVLLA